MTDPITSFNSIAEIESIVSIVLPENFQVSKPPSKNPIQLSKPTLDNLKIVNKSYLYYSDKLNPMVNYVEHTDIILCLPHYLVSLLDESETFYETTTD